MHSVILLLFICQLLIGIVNGDNCAVGYINFAGECWKIGALVGLIIGCVLAVAFIVVCILKLIYPDSMKIKKCLKVLKIIKDVHDDVQYDTNTTEDCTL